MTELNLLNEFDNTLTKHYINEIQIPDYIINNIKHELRDYQINSLQRYIFLNENLAFASIKKKPIHALFNLATGAGKTLLMACMILYYYKKGYRHFLFFVNQSNIVSKTQDNFLSLGSNKYLFKNNILIDGKKINIRKVETFDNDKNNIQIKFSTIQNLHNEILIQKENKIIIDELNKNNIVMISDECHHLNAMTKNSKKTEKEEEKSWENTIINRILKKDENDENVLLEFTATIPNEQTVKEKYLDKTIIKFDLKSFVKEKYTKDVNLIYTSFEKKERILIAILLNWYREEIALKYNINLKPVILFRSKTIEDSREDYKYFLNIIKTLKVEDFDNLKKSFLDVEDKEEDEKNRDSVLLKIDNYIKNNNIKYTDIIQKIKYSFEEKYCIITNSKDNTKNVEETDEDINLLLNSLEDPNNLIRGIFTVNKLTEGWDVLNLYDIVKMYEGQNSGGGNKKSSGSSTVSEVQLIGRGVRLYPFKFEDFTPDKRKFDNDLTNELRILEEFHYHSDNEHRYIADLKKELDKEGLLLKEKQKRVFKFKDKFMKSQFYKYQKIAINKKIPNPNKVKNDFSKIKESLQKAFEYSQSSIAEVDVYENKTKTNIEKKYKKFNIKLTDYKHICYKVFSKSNSSFYTFANLKRFININSIDDLFENKFLGDIKINISFDGEKTNIIIMKALTEFFTELEIKLKQDFEPFVGSKFSLENLKDVFKDDKAKYVEEKFLDKSEYINQKVQNLDWYPLNIFYGTGLEGEFVNFIEKYCIESLKEKYDEVFFIRNEEIYTIYDFQGRGFQPDFLLFLKNKDDNYTYQCFMEVKGDFITEKDKWKSLFLDKIEEDKENAFDQTVLKIESNRFKLIGFPFYVGKESKDQYLEKLEKIN